MIHFILALNIRGQVRLYRFYRSIDSELDKGASHNEDKVGKVPKPLFKDFGEAGTKPTDSKPSFLWLASSSRAEITKSNSAGDFEKKRGVERAKSWNLSRASSGSALIDLSDNSSAETLSHSVPATNELTRDEGKKKPSSDSVDLIGLWEIEQEQRDHSHPSRSSGKSFSDTPVKNNQRENERNTKEDFKKQFISYRLYSNLEDSGSLTPATRAFIDQIYAQVVSKDYQNSPNFMHFRKYKIVFRRYANLYFILGVDMDDDEFSMLEWIHLWMEVLDEYFGDATELDLMYNFYKCYIILDEMICGGNIVETSKDVILTRLAQLEKLEK